MNIRSYFSGALVQPILVVTFALPASLNAAVVEEVFITAEHREASLQETEISMSAFSEDAIEDLGISNGLDLLGKVPNMNVSVYQGGRSGLSFSIRGIVNAETLITFDPGVSVYMDNVLIAKNVGSQLDIAELERIEVLRGPQGTLYGRNTMGGAVNYITKKPSDEFEAKLKSTVGKYDHWELRGMVNSPLMPDNSDMELNLRVAAAVINRDGVLKNDFTGAGVEDEFGTWNRDVGLVQLLFRPIQNLSVSYAYDVTRIDEVPIVPLSTSVDTNKAAGGLIAPFIRPNESDFPERGSFDATKNVAKTDVDGHALTFDWAIADSLNLLSITGYREMENLGASGTDGSPANIFVTEDFQVMESLSQEFRLVGSVDEAIDYTAGVFYLDEEGDVYNTIKAFGFPGSSNTVADYSNESWALYGQLTYYVTDQLSLTGGARYNDEKRKMRKATLSQNLGSPVTYDQYVQGFAMPADLFPAASKSFENFSWLLSVGYDWTEDVMSYFKISTGFQSGGFNVRETLQSRFPAGFNDETLTSYEIGTKATFAERFVVNAAAFFGDYEDKQVNVFDPVTLGNVRQNADAEIWGVELELLAQLNDFWQVGAGYGYLDKTFTRFLDLQGNDVSDTTNFTYAPNNTANMHIAYEQPLDFGLLKARVDGSYRDNMQFLAPIPQANPSGAFTLWNARVTLDEIQGPGDTEMRFSVWGKNLTDEGYWTSGVDVLSSFGFAFNLWGDPRTYGVDAEIRF